MRPIHEVAERAGIRPDRLVPHGRFYAKVQTDFNWKSPTGKLILVTAITPTRHGEGKTVTSIGLAQGLAKAGRNVIVTLRQPSLGPVFGIKGGATGGGMSQVVPGVDINLHFTGDFHAIAAAHNLLAAMVDASLHQGNPLGLDDVVWPRTVDMNDRALRSIRVGLGQGNGPERDGRFVITAASEVMAILALASSRADLRRRLSDIVVGFTSAGEPVRAAALDTVGSMMVLLRDAIYPNLGQTTEGVPALIHCGPFGNIAHGTASVVAQRLALEHADYVVNEAGFASDLGAEKYMDIVMGQAGLQPSAAVVVATGRALAEQGIENLGRHLENVRVFGLPAVVAINQFPDDTEADLARIEDYCRQQGAEVARSEVFAKGGEGALALAEKVIAAADSGRAAPRAVYAPEDRLKAKIEAVAARVYGAAGVEYSGRAESQLARFESLGFGRFPVCMAKTQSSVSDDPALKGAPTGWTLRVSDAHVSAGAGFVVVLAGSMMLMPGLGKSPQAVRIDLTDDGAVTGMY